ncbi:hypothetical protein [Clostridium cavendishii]|nr:hypothetical protein [Clostridium cavendishii]
MKHVFIINSTSRKWATIEYKQKIIITTFKFNTIGRNIEMN